MVLRHPRPLMDGAIRAGGVRTGCLHRPRGLFTAQSTNARTGGRPRTIPRYQSFVPTWSPPSSAVGSPRPYDNYDAVGNRGYRRGTSAHRSTPRSVERTLGRFCPAAMERPLDAIFPALLGY